MWHEYQIMNSNIYQHINITTNSWILIFIMTILQLKTFKTQIIANSRALIYLGLYGSVAEPINHTVFNIPYLSWRVRLPWRADFSRSQSAVNQIESTTIPLLWIVVIQTNRWARAIFRRSAWSPANSKVELPALSENLKTAGKSIR